MQQMFGIRLETSWVKIRVNDLKANGSKEILHPVIFLHSLFSSLYHFDRNAFEEIAFVEKMLDL